jgi:NodT family efflux transporter outer membrane factor (OMF) lipoprotein
MNQHSRSYKVRLTSSLLCLALGGCAVGPDYVKPESRLADFHNRAKSGSKPPTLERWWTGFDDPELVRIVQTVLDQNLDLAAAIARVKEARAVAAGSSSALLPTLDFNSSINRERQSLLGPFGTIASTVPVYKRNTTDYTVGPAASWEIDLFGGLRRGARAAKAEAEAAVADQVGTRVMVAADAADAYFQVRGYQARIAIAESQVKDDERLLQIVQARYEAGTAGGREIAQADALLKQALTATPPLRMGLERQLNRLDVLMGVQPGTYAKTLKKSSKIASFPAIPGDQHPIEVLRRRPDVIAAERRLASSNERIGQAIADYYPKISLAGALGFDSLTTSHLFKRAAFQAVGSGALRWRIFDFGKINAEVAQARGANAAALSVYRQSVLLAAEDVENSLSTLSQTKILVDQLQDEVQALVKSRDLSEESYKAGSITITDVLDADRQLLVARDELDARRVDTARAAVGVFRALGGGWDVAGAQPKASTASR